MTSCSWRLSIAADPSHGRCALTTRRDVLDRKDPSSPSPQAGDCKWTSRSADASTASLGLPTTPICPNASRRWRPRTDRPASSLGGCTMIELGRVANGAGVGPRALSRDDGTRGPCRRAAPWACSRSGPRQPGCAGPARGRAGDGQGRERSARICRNSVSSLQSARATR